MEVDDWDVDLDLVADSLLKDTVMLIRLNERSRGDTLSGLRLGSRPGLMRHRSSPVANT